MVSVSQFQSVTYYLLSCHFVGITHSLTGHVCTRERAENYKLSYNQAFICQERYTTSCGHLDWRRCTRYRIQTCYTPQTKYATRYKQVEECCQGWTQDGAGSCSIPICPHLCQNGGSCVESGGVPGCSCQDGYSGEACQHVKGEWKSYYTVIIISIAVVLISMLAVVGYIYKKRLQSSPRVIPSDADNQDRFCDRRDNRIFFTTQSENGRWAIPRDHNNVYPSAPNG